MQPLRAVMGVWVLFALACTPPAEAPPADGQAEVIARVDGKPLTADDLRAAVRTRPGRNQAVDWNKALEDWVTAQVVAREVSARGLQDSDTYRNRQEAIRTRAWRAEQELARDTLIADVEASLSFSEEDLRAHYEQQRDRFLTTRLRLRQITVPDRETIRAIQKQVTEGEDFAKLASEANLDPALRRSSGDLGWVEQRKMSTAMIGPAHRLLEPGEMSEPFRDREGRWNLVQLIDREKAVQREFADVADQLERELRVIRSREVVANLIAEKRAGVSASLVGAPSP